MANILDSCIRDEILKLIKISSPLSPLKLVNSDLSGLDLRRADFKGCDLSGVSFSNSDLRGADLTGAVVTRADFSLAQISSTTTLRNLVFEGGELEGLILCKTFKRKLWLMTRGLMKFQSSIDYERALRLKDETAAKEVFFKVLNECGIKSEEMNELVYVMAIFDVKQERIYDYYLSENPALVHPAQISLAAILSESSRHDEATELARDYVRKFNDLNLAPNLTKASFHAHVLGRAYLIMTAAYTRLGARNYSVRILEKALRGTISDVMRSHVVNEIAALKTELIQPASLDLDRTWEDFFRSGVNSDELVDLCKNSGASHMAKRIELIEGQFRFQTGYIVSESEVLEQVSIINLERNVTALI